MTRARKPQGLKKVFVVACRFTAREYALLEYLATARKTTPSELAELGTTELMARLDAEQEAKEKGASEQP
jgi:hypothetical protein